MPPAAVALVLAAAALRALWNVRLHGADDRVAAMAMSGGLRRRVVPVPCARSAERALGSVAHQRDRGGRVRPRARGGLPSRGAHRHVSGGTRVGPADGDDRGGGRGRTTRVGAHDRGGSARRSRTRSARLPFASPQHAGCDRAGARGRRGDRHLLGRRRAGHPRWRCAARLPGPAPVGAYAMVLFAFRLAPVGQVATLREVSVVLAVLLARERPGRLGWTGIVAVVTGATLAAF